MVENPCGCSKQVEGLCWDNKYQGVVKAYLKLKGNETSNMDKTITSLEVAHKGSVLATTSVTLGVNADINSLASH